MLTIKKIDAAKPQDKPYKLNDAGGLYLYIAVSGTKSWRLDYKFNKKWKTLTIGKYPQVTLSEAREKRDLAKKSISNNIDPSLEKKKTKTLNDSNLENTFRSIAIEWYSSKKTTWSENYAQATLKIFEKDIFPHIGDEPVNKIKPLEMLAVLKLIEDRGAFEIAKKARMRCSEVFQYAIITGRADYNPARELAAAMINKSHENYAFLTEREMKDFLKDLKGYQGSIVSRMATQLLILSGLRPIELITIKWSDINLSDCVINIRPEEVKKSRKHIVPLSKQAIKILEFLRPITGHSEYVFCGRFDSKKPMSNGTIFGVIRRLGYKNRATGHGFRHQFSTVLNEHGFNRDWVEKQLNHESGSIREVYNHAQYLEQRREMMQWYADYIDKLGG